MTTAYKPRTLNMRDCAETSSYHASQRHLGVNLPDLEKRARMIEKAKAASLESGREIVKIPYMTYTERLEYRRGALHDYNLMGAWWEPHRKPVRDPNEQEK